MANDEELQIAIGDEVIQCRSVEDKIVLEPVGGILADKSTEGYRIEEVEKMASTLEQYGRAADVAELRSLLSKR